MKMDQGYAKEVIDDLAWLLGRIEVEESLAPEKHQNHGIGHYSPNPPRDFLGNEVWHGIWASFLDHKPHPSPDRISKLMNRLQEEGVVQIFGTYGTGGYHFEIKEKGRAAFIERLSLKRGLQGSMKHQLIISEEPLGISQPDSNKKYLFNAKVSKTHTLIRAAFFSKTPVGEWLDVLSENLDTLDYKQIYQTAKGINRNFKGKFGFTEDLFILDFRTSRVKINNVSSIFSLIKR